MSRKNPYSEPFNGCSGGMSKAWRKVTGGPPPWENCCNKHDQDYILGGTAAERAESDRQLRNCVRATGHPVWAWVMWAAVRVGGCPGCPLRGAGASVVRLNDNIQREVNKWHAAECGCKETYQYDSGDDCLSGPDYLECCAYCGTVFDVEEAEDEDQWLEIPAFLRRGTD